MHSLIGVVLCAAYACANLWPQGIVHYAINQKDYDVHSQEEITSTFIRLQSELCIKFFHTPTNYSADVSHKILYVSNPEKRKDCPPLSYDFSGSIVEMPIGYRCLNQKEIARIILDMLKASVKQTVPEINNNDLVQRFQEQEETVSLHTLLKPADRNYINANYHSECTSLGRTSARRFSAPAPAQLTEENADYYISKLWPLAVVMYAVHPGISPTDPALLVVKRAMSRIELGSCVVFQRMPPEDVLEPNNFLWLSNEGEDLPYFGFFPGNQSLNLNSLAYGAPGHAAHALNALLRALGVPMMSNRHDRDNYVTINWKNVEFGKEHYLEKSPESAWLQQIPYDFNSATHAPANFMCKDCNDPIASRTVLPLQDQLWHRTLSMGRHFDMSDGDTKLLNILYGTQCRERFLRDLK